MQFFHELFILVRKVGSSKSKAEDGPEFFRCLFVVRNWGICCNTSHTLSLNGKTHISLEWLVFPPLFSFISGKRCEAREEINGSSMSLVASLSSKYYWSVGCQLGAGDKQRPTKCTALL